MPSRDSLHVTFQRVHSNLVFLRLIIDYVITLKFLYVIPKFIFLEIKKYFWLKFLSKRPSTQSEGHWLEAFIDLRWTQQLFGILMTDLCLNASSGSHLGLATPGQLNLMINNDSPLNWSKLFQLRNLLHNANASFFIFSLQWFSFSILVFFFFSLNIRFEALYIYTRYQST